MRVTRRRLLQLGASSLLTSGCWPGNLFAQDSPPAANFRFLVLNDLHYIDRASGDWFTNRVLPSIRAQERPDFIIIAGDLCENGTRQELGPVKDIFDGLRIPYHVVPGNHDFRAPNDRAIFDELFPRQLDYTFEHRGWQFVGLDTSSGTEYQNTSISRDTLNYLDDALPRLNRQRPTVVFTHFPMGPGVTYRPRNADDLLNRLREFNLQAVFCGHFHGLTERTVNNVLITTNRCCAISRNNHDNTREKGYFSCQARDGRITRTFVEVATA